MQSERTTESFVNDMTDILLANREAAVGMAEDFVEIWYFVWEHVE